MSLTRKIAKSIVEHEIKVEHLESVLTDYNLLSLLPKIKEEVKKLHGEKTNEDIVQIESPFDLSPEAVAKIKRIVGNDLAEANVSINKNILSGFKARFKGRLYDGSGERIIRQLMK
jgi:F0F1-type ATP synthase delta subunit